ncbi:carboxylesterase [Roseomonas sp. HF4]|uniref:alpha/beta hydrolase n=1 Tax=Roseomonas sp. HF4 TaxID=2562313 RepID=UPI0010BFDE59|nr:alpha/beta hydrolase [Roseomonas sp. HF4]
MLSFSRRMLLRGGAAVLALLLVVLGLRIYDVQRGPPLGPWHTFVPEELPRAAIDAADWPVYLAAEDAILRTVRTEVTDQLERADRVRANRYYAGSPVNPMRFAQDWNRSFVLEPAGPVRGAAVFLHGLTDAPFSLRHLAEAYRARGFAAVAIRMPGHGTVPAGLISAAWEDWMAATRLAVREARRRTGPNAPLHLVGYSNGGALALMHALDAIDDPALPRADRIVLLSPMVGVTAFARFAGIAALPALLPRFAKTAWLDLQPEFNPFKYNSFPVNAARQTHRLTAALQARLDRLAAAGRLGGLPPVLTFQSVVDATVSTPAVLSHLYARLPANGSEIVLFDLNRNTRFGPLFGATDASVAALERLLPPAPRAFAVTLLANAAPTTVETVARRVAADATEEDVAPLGLAWPRDIFSLSHVALPFPPRDGLYGAEPDPVENFGVRLGAIAIRGERGVLAVGLESLSRVTSNPFFPYLIGRVTEGLPGVAQP